MAEGDLTADSPTIVDYTSGGSLIKAHIDGINLETSGAALFVLPLHGLPLQVMIFKVERAEA